MAHKLAFDVRMGSKFALDIMSPVDMLEVSFEDNAAEISQRVLREHRSAIVEVGDRVPFGILTAKGSRQLIAQPGQLSNYDRQLVETGLTLPDAPVKQLLQSLRLNKTLGAFIVMENQSPVGVIPVKTLFKVMSRFAFGGGGPVNPRDGLYCYCCPHAVPAHQVSQGDAIFDRADGRKYCPIHKGRLIPKVPCTSC